MYFEARKSDKRVLADKERAYKKKCRAQLEQNINDSIFFWKDIKRFSKKSKPTATISDDEWLQHFKKVFESENDISPDEDGPVYESDDEDYDNRENRLLNDNITEQEILDSIHI